MAEAKKAEGSEGEQPPPKKSKLLLIIIAAVVAVALIGGGATFFLMKKNANHGDEEGDEPPAKEEKAKKAKKDHADAPPVFVKLEAFTVKLQSESQDAYLQAVPELRVLDAHLGDKIKQYNPEIRHKVLLILSGKKASELSTPQGVQQLSNEMRVAINAIIEPPVPRKKGKAAEEPGDQAGPDDPVQAVLFTSFIVQ
ncbi:MAG TPA: flagellar basal body-associated FliL family protein [Rhodocyclaceae bacterium]|nr:flagellar basal body-associated FliL family protein [Rhodocyclaceae bacterium]